MRVTTERGTAEIEAILWSFYSKTESAMKLKCAPLCSPGNVLGPVNFWPKTMDDYTHSGVLTEIEVILEHTYLLEGR